jgi:hypothetical protein
MNSCSKKLAPNSTGSTGADQARLALEKAARCLRLARVILDPDAVRLLEEMAADYLGEAERLSRQDD